jgi:hypothetical protein
MLLLRRSDHVAAAVEHNESRARRALIDRPYVSSHDFPVSCCIRPSWYSNNAPTLATRALSPIAQYFESVFLADWDNNAKPFAAKAATAPKPKKKRA